MYKKLIYTILSIVAMISFAACSGSDSDKKTDAPTATEKPTKAPEETDKTDEKDISSLFDKLEDKLKDDDDETTPTPAPETTPTEAPQVELPGEDITPGDKKDDITDSANAITDGVIVDNDQCSFKIVSIDPDGYWGYTLKVQLENKTDLNLAFSLDDVYVNSVLCDPYWYCDVNAGETIIDEIEFDSDSFDELGITEVTSLTFLLNVYDDDDWAADNLVEDIYTFYPMGKENAITYKYEFDADDVILVNSDELTMAITDFAYDDFWGYVVTVYMENNTDKSLGYMIEDVSVNGFMCDPIWSSEVMAGMRAHDFFYFSQEDLEFNEISEITDIELLFSAYESEDWLGDPLVEEKTTVYPLGKEASKTYNRTPQDSDTVLFDTDDCTMIITGFTTDDYGTFSAIAYLENKTDSNLIFTLENAKINNIDCDPFWAMSICPGKKANCQIRWSDYRLEESGITEVESIELPVLVRNYDDWSADDFINETFTVTP